MFKNRPFSGALMGSIGMNFSFWPLMIYLPLYFQGALGYDSVACGLALLAYTLPTLVFPAVGERLALRYQAARVIPGGLWCIGLGFMLMYLGSRQVDASGLSLLPGCLLAGIGLGITNTPVTNTTTRSLPSARAGMASGIDMSARMISLALNIALMGLVLVAGIVAYLQPGLVFAVDGQTLYGWAQSIAAGQLSVVAEGGLQPFSEASARMALAHGFGWVLLYGCVSVWGLALGSWLIFNRRQCPALGTSV